MTRNDRGKHLGPASSVSKWMAFEVRQGFLLRACLGLSGDEVAEERGRDTRCDVATTDPGKIKRAMKVLYLRTVLVRCFLDIAEKRSIFGL